MKTPLTSAIVDKLSVWKENASYRNANLTAEKKAEYDAELRKIVDFADGAVATEPEWASESDMEIIKKARSYYYGSTFTMAIPAFATAKEGAKKFISYLASDEAIDTYFRNTYGCTLPYEYDYKSNSYYNEISPVAKRAVDISFGNSPVVTETSYISYYKGGLQYDAGINGYNFAITFGSNQKVNRISAEQVIKNIKNRYDSANLKALIENCNL